MRCAFFLLLFCVAAVNLDAFSEKNDTDTKLTLARKIRDLQAADVALRRNDAEFRELRKQNQASKSEISEFAEFVAGLKRQVLESCEAVRKLGGDSSQYSVDCVKLEDESELKKGGASSDSIKESTHAERELTREEKAALLTDQLKKLESDFDGMILKQQDKLREKGEVSQSSGNWARDTDYESEITEAGVRSGVDPIQREAEPGVGPGTEKQGKIPDFEIENVGDGRDDDVVARQLREAAENETDPLLKEKLWDEYKKYKNSMR